MQLIDQADTLTLIVRLVIGVLIDNTDNLLRCHILGIRLTRDIERSGLRRLCTLDGKEFLVIGDKFFIIENVC